MSRLGGPRCWLKTKTNQIIQEKINNNVKLYDLVKDVHDNSCDDQGKMSKVDYYKVKTPWYMKNHQVINILNIIINIIINIE